MKTSLLLIIGIALTFTSLPYPPSLGEFADVVDTFDYSKRGCELLIFDIWQPTQEGIEISKKLLTQCVERGFITQELADMAPDLQGYGTASVTAAYQFANGDILKTIKILQDPNFPNNIRDPDLGILVLLIPVSVGMMIGFVIWRKTK